MPGLPEFVATADSEASDVESPHFEGDAGAEIPPNALGGVGTAPMEDVEEKKWRKKISTSTSNESGKVDPVRRGSEEASSLHAHCYCRG